MEDNMALRSLQRAMAIPMLWLGCIMLAPVWGQQAEHPAPTIDKLTEAEVGPRGQHMPRNITFSGWRKLCFEDSLGKTICRTTTSGNWDTGQTAVRIDLIERKGDNATRIQIFLPVGLYLQAGVKLTIDDDAAVRVPYSWCLTNTCVAGNLLAPRLVRAMESGQKLTLEVVDSNLLTVATAVSLDQFAAAHKGPPAKTYEIPNDEE
jgi:invasion protein IalB